MKQQETAFSAKKRWEWELSIDCLVGRVYVVWSSPQIPLNNLCFPRTLLTSVLFLGSYFVDENLTTPFNFILGEVLKKNEFQLQSRETQLSLFSVFRIQPMHACYMHLSSIIYTQPLDRGFKYFCLPRQSRKRKRPLLVGKSLTSNSWEYFSLELPEGVVSLCITWLGQPCSLVVIYARSYSRHDQ